MLVYDALNSHTYNFINEYQSGPRKCSVRDAHDEVVRAASDATGCFFSVVLFQPAAFYLDLDLDPARAAARTANEHDALNAAQLCARDADLEPVLFPTMPPCQTPTTMCRASVGLHRRAIRHACLCAIANTV